MPQVHPAQGSHQPSPRLRPLRRASAGIVGAGETVLIVLGCVFAMPVLVFPWTAMRIRRSLSRGEVVATRWVLGAVFSGLLLVAGIVLWVAVAASFVDDVAASALAWALAAAGAVPLLLGLGMIVTSRRPAGRAAGTPRPAAARVVVDKQLFDDSELGRRVEGALRRLSGLVPVYAGYEIGGAPVPAKIGRIVEEFQDLIRRLDARGTPQQVRMAKAQFADVLEKVVLCVSPEHLKDVIDNPRLWSQPEQRVAAIGAMLDEVSAEIVENIRQVNSRTDLDFQVALTSLNALTRDDELDRLLRGAS